MGGQGTNVTTVGVSLPPFVVEYKADNGPPGLNTKFFFYVVVVVSM